MTIVRDSDGNRIGTQDEFGNVDLDPLYEKHLKELGPCPVCGMVETLNGRTCSQCKASIDEDRFWREIRGG